MNMHLNKLIILCLFLPMPLFAAWSGINFTIGDETLPIINHQEELSLTPFQLKISAEEKTASGLRIGVDISKIELDIESATHSINTAADAIGLYLYFPYEINPYIDIISYLSFTKALANPNSELEGEIDYLTKKVSLGLRLKWNNWRITPIISAFSLNGDFLNLSTNTLFSFTEKQTNVSSINIDYQVEPNSFIRFSITEHTDNTFSISFITLY